MNYYYIVMAILAVTLRVSAEEISEAFTNPNGRPKVAVLRFENVSDKNSSTTIINPALTPVIAGLVARKQSTSDIVFTSARQEVERYSEQARSLLERELASWPEIEVLERSRLDVLERERDLNAARGGKRRQTERQHYQHGVDYFIIGQIMDIWTTGSEFQGYGIFQQLQTTHAHLYIRVISVATEQEIFTMDAIGSAEHLNTQLSATQHSDEPAAATKEAIRLLLADSSFKKGFVTRAKEVSKQSAAPGDPVEVVFKPSPRRVSVEIDGNYIGETPLKRRLLLGAKHTIRLGHPSGKVWERTIVVEKNLVVAPEIGVTAEKE